MLEGIKNLFHRQGRPSAIDRALMERAQASLPIFGLERPAGTIFRSIPGAILKYEMIAGTVVPRVYGSYDNRLVGHFKSNGDIVYDSAPSQP